MHYHYAREPYKHFVVFIYEIITCNIGKAHTYMYMFEITKQV